MSFLHATQEAVNTMHYRHRDSQRYAKRAKGIVIHIVQRETLRVLSVACYAVVRSKKRGAIRIHCVKEEGAPVDALIEKLFPLCCILIIQFSLDLI